MRKHLFQRKYSFSNFLININSLIILRYQKITYDFWKLIYLETFVAQIIKIEIINELRL
jgi:hypothetical protein